MSDTFRDVLAVERHDREAAAVADPAWEAAMEAADTEWHERRLDQ
jgi:hypothetical protein